MSFIKKSKIASVIGAGMVAMLALSACDEPDVDSQNRNNSHQAMQESQPAQNMSYSPTRETINFWVDTWDEPGKLSYVYLQNQNGDVLGYYVLEGLPVSYCAQISPNFEISRGEGKVVTPAPANDGAYYGEGNCNTYYGRDATTGAYIEYTAGMGINVLLFDQPMPHVNHQELNAFGGTQADDIEGDASELNGSDLADEDADE